MDDAQNALGLMYGQGRGINRDAKEALRWLMKAAAQGNVKAHVNLSTSYFHGYVTPKDYLRSAMWLVIAAAGGYRDDVSHGWSLMQALGPEAETRAKVEEMAATCVSSKYVRC